MATALTIAILVALAAETAEVPEKHRMRLSGRTNPINTDVGAERGLEEEM